MYILTFVSTIVLPLSLIASLFGGNVGNAGRNVLGMRHPLWFIGLCVALVLLGWGIYAAHRHFRFL
ncbi:MAG: CorA family divalent cation transporter [Longimicrobiales bacterium]